MGSTQQAAQATTTRISLTYNEQTGIVTRDPASEFKVGELLEFRSSDPDELVKVVLHPPTAYEPNIYDETNPNRKPVRVVNTGKGAVWCYFRKRHSPHTSIWSERYGFLSDPGT
jgi:hypothetical protein